MSDKSSRSEEKVSSLNARYFYLSRAIKTVNSKKYVVVNILEYNTLNIYAIFKPYSSEYVDKIDNTFSPFDEINSYIVYAIQKDAKFSLDIDFHLFK